LLLLEVKSRLLVLLKKRFRKFARRFLHLKERLTGGEVRLKKVKTIVSMSSKMVLTLITLPQERVLVVSVVMEV
jgi:hypothetical protein